jgi:hypothetical protein
MQSWLEQQEKYIGLKIKKSGGYCNILPKRDLVSFLFLLFHRYLGTGTS